MPSNHCQVLAQYYTTAITPWGQPGGLDHGPQNISFPYLAANVLWILQKRCTTVEWRWWHHPNAKLCDMHNNTHITQSSSPKSLTTKLGPCSEYCYVKLKY